MTEQTDDLIAGVRRIVEDEEQWDVRIHGSALARTTLRELLTELSATPAEPVEAWDNSFPADGVDRDPCVVCGTWDRHPTATCPPAPAAPAEERETGDEKCPVCGGPGRLMFRCMGCAQADAAPVPAAAPAEEADSE